MVAAFRDLRAKCDDVRQSALHASDAGDAESMGFSADAWRQQIFHGKPTTNLIAVQDVVSLHCLLVVVIDAIVDAHDAVASNSSPARDDAAEASSKAAGPFGPDSLLAEWAFAVLAFVEEPLVDDIQYNLQRLRRACQNAIVSAHARSEAGGVTFDGSTHAQASLLLTLVREHFGQR